jgi:hypothetical protein
MKRRSFFGVLFGGLAAAVGLRPYRSVTCAEILQAMPESLFSGPYDQPFGYGFSGFKPPDCGPSSDSGDTEIERWAAHKIAQGQLERELGQELIRTYAPGQRRLRQYMPRS